MSEWGSVNDFRASERGTAEEKTRRSQSPPALCSGVHSTLKIPEAVLMWQAAGNAARAAGRFARRHRRAIVVGGVVGAAACVYHSMKKALKEAEEEHAAMLVQAGDEVRRRQCLSRTRAESVAALANFLPALKKRLFLAVDVTGPVRELKALRTGAGSAAAGARRRESAGSIANGNVIGTDAVVDARAAVAEEEAEAAAADLQSREVELWEQVKVTALTRLVVSLYAFSALALMLHMQLHILGRLSFEESQELLRRTNPAPGGDSGSGNNEDTNNDRDYSTDPSVAPNGGPPSGTAAAAAAAAAAATREAPTESASSSSSERGGTAGVALSMEARHALLSSTYEHVLGDGLRALVRDVERAVSRCTHSWQAHTRQGVEFQDLVAVIRRVRRDVEGPVGGSGYYSDGDGGGVDAYGGGGGGGGGGGRPSGVRHALLLRYIINPSDGIDSEGASTRTVTPAAGVHQAYPRARSPTDNGRVTAGGSFAYGNGSGGGAVGAPRALQGVEEVLDETWDTAESPNFAAALQSCLDAAFGMVYEQLRQKAFCRGGATGAGLRRARPQTPSVATATCAADAAAELRAGNEDETGGRTANPAPQPGAGTAAAAAAATTGPAAADNVGGARGADVAVGCGDGVGFVPAAPAVAEREESAQVLATVISQAKLVVSDVLEASPRNEYAQAVASLPAVQDLCFSVFGSGGGHRSAPPSAAPLCPTPPSSTATTLPALVRDGLTAPACYDGRATIGGHADGGARGDVGARKDGVGADGGCGGGGGVGGVGGPSRTAGQRAR